MGSTASKLPTDTKHKKMAIPKTAPVVPITPAPVAPVAPETPKSPEPKPEPTSPKLVELKNHLSEIDAKIAAATDAKARQALYMEIFTKNNEITAEIANIAKVEREQAAQEKRNKSMAFIENFESAVVAYHNVTMDMPQDARDLVTKEYQDAKEKLGNIVLGTAPKSSTGATTNGNGEVKSGTKSAAILELYKAKRAEGLTDTAARKAVVDANFNDGTMGLVVKAYLDAHPDMK